MKAYISSNRKTRIFTQAKIHIPVSIFLGIILLLAFACNKKTVVEDNAIHKGPFMASITETGELDAIKAFTIMTPVIRRFRRLTIIHLVEHGKKVEKGDLVVQLDPAEIENYLEDEKTDYEVEKAKMNILMVQNANSLKDLNTDLKVTQADYDMQKLELEKFQFESDTKKKVKSLEFEQATIKLNNIKEKIELENNISKNEMKIQKIRVEQRKENIEKAEEWIDMLSLYSEIDGFAQILSNWSGGDPFKLGDQVWRGMPLVKIPDVSKMRVKSSINEADIAKIKKGQKVIIRLDAFPKKSFQGVIKSISRISHRKDENSKVKIFDVVIEVIDSDPALKPGMTVSCEYIYADYPDAFYVPNECIYRNIKGAYIYLKTIAGYEQQKVKIAENNEFNTVIIGNFKEGRTLIPVEEITPDNESK